MDNAEREYLEELRHVHRNNLQRLTLQKAQHSLDVPPVLTNGIEYEAREIARIDSQLQQGRITNNFYTSKTIHSQNKNKMLLSVIGSIASLLLGLLLGMYLQRLPTGSISTNSYNNDRQTAIGELQATPQSINSIIFPVDAEKQHWQSTGVTVLKGNKIIITVVGGKWTGQRIDLSNELQIPESVRSKGAIWQYTLDENAGEGVNFSCHSCPIDTQDHATELIASINQVEPLEIGSNHTFTATSDGEIFLQMNTQSSSKPEGILAVEIKVER